MARALPGTTDRVIALLRCVAEAAHGLTLTELARAMDLAPSTIHRMLDRLGALGIVRLARDGRHYVAGLEFYRLSALVMAQTDFTDIARRDLAGLAEESGETCFLALYMPSDRRMMYDARATGSRSIQIVTELHAPIFMSSGAAGLAMLSALEPLDVDAVLSGEGGTGAPRAILFEVLAEIRRSGYALCRDEGIADAVEIAAPLSDATGRMIGALSIAVPEAVFSQHSEPLLSRQVMDRAKGLSRRLGDTAIRQERRRVQDWTLR